MLTSFSESVEPDPSSDDDLDTSFDPDEVLKATKKLADDLSAIPLPTEQREDVEQFVEMFATSADAYERVAPRINEASKRLSDAIKSIDPDSLPPPPPDSQTVAGGIMSQMMSIPEVRDAWDDMMSAYEEASQSIPTKQYDLLIERLGLKACEEESTSETRLPAAELKKCGSRGKPVTLARLVETFRANGLTFDIDEDTCKATPRERREGARPDATNAGPSGLDSPDGVEEREGFILCDVDDSAKSGRDVRVNRYPDEYETWLDALNVHCTIYPSDVEHRDAQVEQLRKAMVALVRAAPR
jgi:hypothetical protein